MNDGVSALEHLLARAGYTSVAAAVAEHTRFVHPETVAQTGGSALFPITRNPILRGQFGHAADGRRVLLDDNTSPTYAFLWASGLPKGRDIQYNHVWRVSADPDAYTALWNVCATPAFLAKTTDGQNHPEVTGALRYHAWRMYGTLPAGHVEPSRPTGYAELQWAPLPPPLRNLEMELRQRLRRKPKSPMARAAREIGWLFSAWEPDPTI